MQHTYKLTPALFIVSIILFFLPWIHVDCGGQTVASFSGLELVTGTTVESDAGFGQRKKEKIDPEAVAIILAIVTVAGLVLSLSKLKENDKIMIATGTLCLLLGIILQIKLNGDAKKNGLITLSYQFGYWLNLLVYLLIIVLNFMVMKKPVDEKKVRFNID